MQSSVTQDVTDLYLLCCLIKKELLFHLVVVLLSLMFVIDFSSEIKVAQFGHYCIVHCIFVASHETWNACQGHSTLKFNIT